MSWLVAIITARFESLMGDSESEEYEPSDDDLTVEDRRYKKQKEKEKHSKEQSIENDSEDYESENQNLMGDFSNNQFYTTSGNLIVATEDELAKMRPEQQVQQYGCVQHLPNTSQIQGTHDTYEKSTNAIDNSWNEWNGTFLVTKKTTATRRSKKRLATTKLAGGANNKRRLAGKRQEKHFHNGTSNSNNNTNSDNSDNSDNETTNTDNNDSDNSDTELKTDGKTWPTDSKSTTTTRLYFKHYINKNDCVTLGASPHLRLTSDCKNWLYMNVFYENNKVWTFLYDQIETITGGTISKDIEPVGGTKAASIPFNNKWQQQDNKKRIFYGMLAQTIVNLEVKYLNDKQSYSIARYMDFLMYEKLRSEKYYNSNALLVFDSDENLKECAKICKLRYSKLHLNLDFALISQRCLRSNFLSANAKLQSKEDYKYVYNFSFYDSTVATRDGIQFQKNSKKKNTKNNKRKLSESIDIGKHFGFQKLSEY